MHPMGAQNHSGMDGQHVMNHAGMGGQHVMSHAGMDGQQMMMAGGLHNVTDYNRQVVLPDNARTHYDSGLQLAMKNPSVIGEHPEEMVERIQVPPPPASPVRSVCTRMQLWSCL
jgi:hypothetical protein